MQRFKRWLALILIGAVAHLLVPWPVSAQPPDKEQKAEDVQKQAEEAQKALETFLRKQRVLFRRGELALELGLFYSQDTKETFLRSDTNTVFAKITKSIVLPSLIYVMGSSTISSLTSYSPSMAMLNKKLTWVRHVN